ncbi:MAG: sigma-54-dependent Fis family transcriptional regulator [Desulfobacteraceae bacterium]|nr:sigma-54-dependent Fis family transcriptional regulator [Desulfobacteraceae bacterium]MBC2752798.1 sigma-54-dependent Fis family transcriptional regulator [Desulfobacteraceae bacterium]
MAIKDFRYHISLYVIVPVIFAGIAFLSALLTFLLAQHYHRLGQDGSLQIHLWALLFALVSFFCGLVVTRLLLMPVKRFIQRANDIPVISRPEDEQYRRKQVDEIKHFKNVFERVEDVLTKLDARQLFPEIIGDSRVMRGLLRRVQMVAPTDSTVLILGESGTGKELVASSIHRNSRRNQNPFIKLNCVAIPPDLLESELFGHEKGAFTGATARKPGKFELAHGGTIFLDEIGDMPLGLQAKILRVIQEKEFDRVGGTRTVQVDVRLICATNKNLPQMVAEGTFREDLYYRINVFALQLPVLRERKEDIPLLVDDFLSRTSPEVRISSPALQMMIGYDWPGNVRELQNTVERAAVLSQGQEIVINHLPESITQLFQHAFIENEDEKDLSIDDKLKEIEKGMIIDALKRTNGIQIRAAELMGINQRSLWHRIKKYQIDAAAFKSNKG